MEEIMNKFKDFLYDKSDILVALGILLIAVLLIAWRLAAIVEYPKELVETNNATVYEEPEEDSVETPKDDPQDNPEDTPSDEPESTSVWGSNGLLAKDITVKFSGNSASAIVDCAVNAGLFEDYYDYANVCLNNGISDPEQIPISGTITFPAGSSPLEVAMKIKGL